MSRWRKAEDGVLKPSSQKTVACNAYEYIRNPLQLFQLSCCDVHKTHTGRTSIPSPPTRARRGTSDRCACCYTRSVWLSVSQSPSYCVLTLNYSGIKKTNAPRTYKTSFIRSAIAMYSSSVVESVTHSCILESQDTTVPSQHKSTPESEHMSVFLGIYVPV